ncbi:Hypothetical predicted protein [Paramuricea clavata]|uniref:Uncharacterized protein n=1 Tax=Paramuricea clavata TaxID=317549 RepID=A0A7D9J2K5_PARCT|nr:Hypothetical predicted protein [Paramuricea clavata]
MQMVHLRNIIRQQSPAGTRRVENVDLDERIRRIREANRERERRFEEIEQDKKLASDPALMENKYEQDKMKESLKSNVQTDVKSNQLKTMKGIQPTATKKIAKGRGQKLRELSNHPLKAERFKSRTKDQNESLEEYLPEKVTLINNCRSSIRERIKTKNKDCTATVPMVENENTQESDVSKVDDKLDCTPQGQQNEIPEDEILLHENKNSSQTTQESNDTQQSDDMKEETKAVSHRENVSPCEKNQQNSTETDQFLDNTEQETSASNRQLAEEPTTQKNKPKIRVTLKKTASSSSFDESMAMLSPLDLPQNWGDIDFSDDELPPVSIWKNS